MCLQTWSTTFANRKIPEIIFFNHQQTRVWSGVLFSENFNRNRYESFSRSDFGIWVSVSKVIEGKYSENHPGRPSSHDSPISDNRMCDLTWWFSRVVLRHPQVVRLVSITHFLEFGGAGRLYIRVRDLPRAMRPKLVVIEASRILFECIFIYRVPLSDNSEMCSREVS